jgi:hypothetical protein
MKETVSNVYFAADEVDRLIDTCEMKINNWGAAAGASGFMSSVVKAQWRNNAAYYASMLEAQAWDTGLTFGGDKGEFVKSIIPKARVLIRQFVSLATKQRYSFDVVTDVADSDPVKTARIGNSIVKNESEKHHIDLVAERIVETVAIEGICCVTNTWDTGSGKIYGRMDDKGNMLYSGGNRLEMYTFNDMMFDWTKKNPDDLDWVIFRNKKNRWDLIAQFPELEDKIRSLPSAQLERLAMPTLSVEAYEINQDEVYVREFYHKPTPALPFGRMAIYCNKDTVLFDGENPYEGIPAVFFVFQQIKNTLLGYPMMSNLLTQQELYTAEISTIATNHSAFGVQSVLVPKGSNISVNQVSKGMTFIDYTPQGADGGGKPEPMQLTSTPPEVFNFVQMMSAGLEELSMINSTLRGQPPANVTSGAMAATLSANALEFIYSDTKGLTIGLEQLMSMSIKNYKKFASVEQIIDVIGEGNTSTAQEFKGSDVKGVKQVKIRQGNPLLNTIAGRLQLGESILPLLQQGKNDAISRYLGLLEGAPIETLFQSELSEDVAVMQEIEALQRGDNVAPLITDNHPMYIRAYQKLLYNPSIRLNGPMVQSILSLIMERAQLEMQCPPDVKAMLRGLPMPQMGMPPQAMPTNQPPSNPSEAVAPPEAVNSNAATPSVPQTGV